MQDLYIEIILMRRIKEDSNKYLNIHVHELKYLILRCQLDVGDGGGQSRGEQCGGYGTTVIEQ